MFSHIGLTSLYDCRWFRKSDITPNILQTMTEELVNIEPYYLPRKKYMCYRDMTPQRMISVLRHIAKSRNLILETHEKSRYARKEVFYRLRCNVFPESYTVCVTFD